MTERERGVVDNSVDVATRAADRLGALGILRSTIGDLIAHVPHRDLLLQAVDALAAAAEGEGAHRLAALDVPLIIADGLGGARHGRQLAAVTAAAYIGIDVVDDLLDGDAPPYWPDPTPSQIALGAALAYCTLAQSQLLRIDVPPDVQVGALQDLTDTLVSMAAAEELDVSAFGRHLDPAEALRVVTGKSGDMLACFARVAARSCGVAPGARLDRFGEFGTQLATARQLGSDIMELEPSAASADHRNCAVTFPIALAASALGTPAVRELQTDASENEQGRQALWDALVSSGALSQALVYAELASTQAIVLGGSLGLTRSAEAELVALCERASLLELAEHHLTT